MLTALHCASGLTKELSERWARNARMMTIPGGTTQIHHLIIGRELTCLRALA
jgi:alkylation response protein AidB-like acyl-CoA dehydrogenase